MLKFRLVLAAGASLPLAAFAVLGSSQPDSVARTLLAGCQLASVEPPPFVYGADPGGQTGGPPSVTPPPAPAIPLREATRAPAPAEGARAE